MTVCMLTILLLELETLDQCTWAAGTKTPRLPALLLETLVQCGLLKLKLDPRLPLPGLSGPDA